MAQNPRGKGSSGRDLEDVDLPPVPTHPDDPQPLIQGETGLDDSDHQGVHRRDGQRRSRAEEDAYDADHGPGLASSPQEQGGRSFRDEWTQEALPNIPKVPGWHYCWLSATNQWDPIPRRVRMGYVPVKAEEVPEYIHLSMKSGEWAGCIGINEMVLFKCPMERYQQIMMHFHHDAPLEEEASIRENAVAYQDEVGVDRKGRQIVEIEPGTQTLGRRPRRNPTFS